MTALLSRLLRHRFEVKHLKITVYTRRDCCCCHKAIDLLKGYQRRYRFSIEEVDIDADLELVDRYGTSVPVVAIDGKVRFRGVVNPMLLERILIAESRGR